MFNRKLTLEDKDAKKFKKLAKRSLIAIFAVLFMGIAIKFVTPVTGLKQYEKFKTGDGSVFEISQISRSKDGTKADVQVYATNNQTDPSNPIKSSVVEKKGDKKSKYPSKIEQINDNYYVIHVKDINPRKNSFFMKLNSKAANASGMSGSSAEISIYRTKRQSINKSVDQYIDDYYQFMIHYSKEKIAANERKVVKDQENIEKLDKILSNQKNTLKMLSKSDQKNTKNRISSTKNKISTANSTLKTHQNRVKRYKQSCKQYQKK